MDKNFQLEVSTSASVKWLIVVGDRGCFVL